MKFKGNQEPTRDPDVVKGLPLREGVVNRETYADKALAFCRASGRIDGEHPIIRRDDEDKGAWLTWMAFLAKLNVPCGATKQRGTMTVPSMWPWDFSEDADYLRDRVDGMVDQERLSRPPLISPERRKELADMLRGVIRSDLRGTQRTRAKDRRGGVLGGMPTMSDIPLPKLSDEALRSAGYAQAKP